MLTWRAIGAVLALFALNSQFTTCRSPGEGGKEPAPSNETKTVDELPGVDTDSLTTREKREWSGAVTELLAPCPDQPVSLAQCVEEKRKCKSCLPAVQLIAQQVKKGKTRSQVEAAFRTRFSPDTVAKIDVSGSPVKGAPDAPVTIVEWADFECPFCGRAAPFLDMVLKQYPGKVRLIFKNYPLSIHQHAEKAARAAVAAGKQGKFWEMHDLLFENHEKGLSEATIKQLARKLGLDMKQFDDDLDSEPVADAVARDRKQADKLDLKGTPMLWINGRHFDFDHFDLNEDLRDWIELEVEMKTGQRPEPVSVKGEAEAGALGEAKPSKKGQPDELAAPEGEKAGDGDAKDGPAPKQAKQAAEGKPKQDGPAPKKAEQGARGK